MQRTNGRGQTIGQLSTPIGKQGRSQDQVVGVVYSRKMESGRMQIVHKLMLPFVKQQLVSKI